MTTQPSATRKAIGHWANIPSHGCFAFFEHELAERPTLARTLLEGIVDGLGLGPDTLKISTKDYHLQWSKFAWKKLDAALEKGLLAVTLMVGEPSEVHLAARLTLRLDPRFERTGHAPPMLWLAAEGERWPVARLLPVARALLRLAAEHGHPLSGGIFAARQMWDAKVEASLELESFEGEVNEPFSTAIRQDRAWRAWDQLRRVYPVTLLGPLFAARTSDAHLHEAGAVAVERVGQSLLVDATPELVEAWSPTYLAATKRLRELVWPWSFQHPLDDPKRKVRR